MRIEYKESAVYSNGGFFVLGEFVGERDSANAKPYKYTDDCSMKSKGDRANAKLYKHTGPHPTKSEWDSAVLEGLVRAQWWRRF